MTTALRKPRHPVRFVTAASLFDGHDASINVIRRVLQEAGCEVIHLGHNRSVSEIVTAAIQEDAQAIAISSYQGGHVEFFQYIKDLLREQGAAHIRVFGGGGGTIVPREIAALQTYGVDRIFSPEDGRRLGLEGMINEMVAAADFDPLGATGPGDSPPSRIPTLPEAFSPRHLARALTYTEQNGVRAPDEVDRFLQGLRASTPPEHVPVIGITGPGGAGKSSFTDELLRRYLRAVPEKRVAVLAIDPTKRRTGGALLGDRIRMNSIYSPRVFMRSLATRCAGTELSAAVKEAILVFRGAGFSLILLESSGIGQGGSGVVDHADVSVYVMTPEYGAASQLEKIDMIDLADVVVINKFDRRGAQDALRDVRKQYRRARKLFEGPPDDDLPVFGAVSSRFHDSGVTAAFQRIMQTLEKKLGRPLLLTHDPKRLSPVTTLASPIVPARRSAYLAEIAESVHNYHRASERDVAAARRLAALSLAAGEVSDPGARAAILSAARNVETEISANSAKLLASWPEVRAQYGGDDLVFRVRDKDVRQRLRQTSLSGLKIPRIAVPKTSDAGEVLRFLLLENLPGNFPFTAGVFALKRQDEDPKRMFAGEGGPERTNRRFHYLCRGEAAKRLSTAFDSVTLYGRDPERRPDIYGKIGESGVSICTLDDMRRLFLGFDLCDPNTSVSMTINGPAPVILAMFLNAAIDQEHAVFEKAEGRRPNEEESKVIAARTLSQVRGTVQADILKEDQAQNTCIFSTDFALRMMGDVQSYFIENRVRNYYSVSISGYHIAEAGANPISQLAFTLANGFTYVEAYQARGMKVDDFAQNLSFFFSNGLDPEYTVLGRVARRIWAVAMRDIYGANDRAQKLKYHIQTSGRSLHAQEIDFNDIRTTLQALLALQDHCNSLHTNAFDEAVTTPTEDSVRRAMAIQYIINKEFGLAISENSLQGSYLIEELTELVEAAVLKEFERISERGGVLGAMETEYQRGKIQEESLHYERLKHSGELPIVGVNTFVNESADHAKVMDSMELTRCSPAEKDARIVALGLFQETHRVSALPALRRLQEVAIAGGNIFAELMSTVRVASLGQITDALFEVGGEYRRNM